MTSKMPSNHEFVRVRKLSEHATIPTKGTRDSAGHDLSSAYDAVVPARGHVLVKTDLSIDIPWGTYGRIAPRSGLALKHAIDVGAGVIDWDYKGNIGVILFNHSDTPFEIKQGDRIAQIIFERIMDVTMTEPKSRSDQDEEEEEKQNERGTNGFGSTGV